MTWRTFVAFVVVGGLVVSGGIFHSGAFWSGAIGIALNTMLLGFLVAHLERASQYTLSDVLVEDGVHVADISGRNADSTTPLYLLTKEGRIRPVVRMFNAHFDGERVLVLEEKYVRESD